ncbi:outer membrane beta-barrel protein [Flavobacterium sp. MC2016-06]|uniref:outer membrane beta-barrel protein n=1 Tax=Flavobacterium sp. MC2016-06 TaxID=2676308 RepID=UPI0012BA7F91|nr:outer membrane beta-barrel protein [Flavobacterium sp. MC2016-06]MBU3861659.1 porin family protein [Flavobacterium sp. MC2016-06]
MKKFILAVLLCISVNGFAQLIQVGPQFSTNITSLNSDNFSSKSSGTGVGFAAFARVNLLMFYGQAEFGYAQSKFDVSYTGVGETEYELSGTDATLIAGFKIIPLGKLGNVRVFAGYNWKNYSDIKVSNDLNPIALEKNNHSILGGVGVDLWRFTLDYRYLGGLTDIDSSEGDIKTRVSTVSLGFKFL